MFYFDYSTFYLDHKTKKEVLEQINRIRKQVNEIEDVFTGEIEGVVRRVLNEGDILEDYLLKNDFYDFKDEIISQIDTINSLIDVLYDSFEDYYTKDEVVNLISGIDLSDYYTKSETYSKEEVDQAIENVEVDLSNYYTKSETYNKQEVDQAIENVEVDLSNYYTKDETYSKQEVDQAISDVSTGDVDLSDYYTMDEIHDITEHLAPKIDSYYFKELKPWNLVEGDFRNMEDIADDWEIMIDSEEMYHVPGVGIYLPSSDENDDDEPNLKPMNLNLNDFVGDTLTIYLKGVNAESSIVGYHLLDNDGSAVDVYYSYVYPYPEFLTEYTFIVEENMSDIALEVYGFTLEYVVISNSVNPYDVTPNEYLPRLKDGVAEKDESVLGRMVQNMYTIMNHMSYRYDDEHWDDE